MLFDALQTIGPSVRLIVDSDYCLLWVVSLSCLADHNGSDNRLLQLLLQLDVSVLGGISWILVRLHNDLNSPGNAEEPANDERRRQQLEDAQNQLHVGVVFPEQSSQNCPYSRQYEIGNSKDIVPGCLNEWNGDVHEAAWEVVGSCEQIVELLPVGALLSQSPVLDVPL